MIQGHVNFNKKGLSDVFANVLLILGAVALVSVLGVILFNYIHEVGLSPKLNCVEMQSSKVLAIENACYDSKLNELRILLKRNIEFLENIQFAISSDSGDSSWKCGTGCLCKVPGDGESKNYYFAVDGAKEISILVDGCLIDKRNVNNC